MQTELSKSAYNRGLRHSFLEQNSPILQNSNQLKRSHDVPSDLLEHKDMFFDMVMQLGGATEITTMNRWKKTVQTIVEHLDSRYQDIKDKLRSTNASYYLKILVERVLIDRLQPSFEKINNTLPPMSGKLY